MSIIDKLFDVVFRVHNLKASNQRLSERLRQVTAIGSDWDRDQELITLREAVQRLTPQKQFRILAKGPCLPGTHDRETRYLDITSVASSAGVTTISVDAPWLLPKGGTP